MGKLLESFNSNEKSIFADSLLPCMRDAAGGEGRGVVHAVGIYHQMVIFSSKDDVYQRVAL